MLRIHHDRRHTSTMQVMAFAGLVLGRKGHLIKRSPRYGGSKKSRESCQFWRALLCKVVSEQASEVSECVNYATPMNLSLLFFLTKIKVGQN